VLIMLFMGALHYFHQSGLSLVLLPDRRIYYLYTAFCCYLMAVLLSSLVAYNTAMVLKSFIKWFEVLIISVLVVLFSFSAKRYRLIYWLLFVAPFLFILEVLYRIFTGEISLFSFRVFPGNESLYALALFLPFAGARKKGLFLIVFLICTISVALSLSRGAWIMYFAIIFYSFSYSSKKITHNMAIFLALLLLLLMLTPEIMSLFVLRLDSFFASESTSNIERMALIKYAISAFLENPILGVGSLNFPNYFINKGLMEGIYADKYEILEPHNAFLQVAAEEGIIGLISFASWIIIMGVLLFSQKSSNPEKQKLLSGLKTFYLVLISNLAYGYIASQFRFYLALFWGLTSAALVVHRNEQNG
jgi:hypothetical protein